MKSFLRPRRDIPYKSPSLYSAFYKLLIYSEFDTYSIAEHCQLPSTVRGSFSNNAFDNALEPIFHGISTIEK